MSKKIIPITLCFILFFSIGLPEILSGQQKAEGRVKLGIDVLSENGFSLLKGKKVGLITNITGVNRRLELTQDILRKAEGVKLVALFGPEHGLKGGVQGNVEHAADNKTDIPVYSLFGRFRSPTPEMLKGIEVLLFDIQDIGTRSYTYISTLKLCMEAAAKQKIKFIVLDRPNPINGILVDGPVLEPGFESFMGIEGIAYVHGMTIGELALFFNSEFNINCDLQVVKMQGWSRKMSWSDTGLFWVPTSPHIPEMDTPWFYPVTGIVGELGGVNIGVGYTLPFKLIGAPWIKADELSIQLNAQNIPGVLFQPFYYQPYYGLYKNEPCEGVRIVITDKTVFRPVVTGYRIIATLLKMYPQQVDFKSAHPKKIKAFDDCSGTDKIRLMFEQGKSTEDIVAAYSGGLNNFLGKRQKYLLYD